ncbi:MAG: PhnD/SsuA/transferrin family substrate-binding protein [Ilumatobacteraceae bacterium]|nr:PhnD/SsuA/transferrin family substrate-binding protein [Ilumatobacteraceae bacterium]
MYDFPEVQDSTLKLLAALVDALTSCGEVVHAETPDGSVHEKLMEMWCSNDTALSQSCGLPFVEDLNAFVDVIGTFLWTDVSDARGRYQTVIVVREALGISSIADVRGLRPVVSNTQSLSGWCSLGVALSEVTTEPSFVQPFTQSGGHAKSLQMLQDNEADIASIDSATFRLLSRHRPELANGVRVIGYGPLVPATPIIVSKSFAVDADELYRVVSGVFGRSDLRASLADIGISGFVRLANSDYDGVMDLVKIAEVVLPRK